jgi:ribulose-phosphate 3-epimerase
MDGHFVPNLTFGPQLVHDIRPETEAFLDVHLMVENPEQYFDDLAHAGAQMATIHPETTYHLDRVVNEIKALGMQAGIALNPGTPIEACEWVLGSVDRILVMTVNPGFGGQSFIEGMTPKIARLAEIRRDQKLSFEIAVDGGITAETAPSAIDNGATYLVAGSSVFHHKDGPAEGFRELQALVSER